MTRLAKCGATPLVRKLGHQALRLDVGITCTVDPFTQVGLVQAVAQQGDDAGLDLLFDLADGATQGAPFTSLNVI